MANALWGTLAAAWRHLLRFRFRFRIQLQISDCRLLRVAVPWLSRHFIQYLHVWVCASVCQCVGGVDECLRWILSPNNDIRYLPLWQKSASCSYNTDITICGLLGIMQSALPPSATLPAPLYRRLCLALVLRSVCQLLCANNFYS